MKIQNNTTKTTIILTTLVFGILLLSPTTVIPNINAQINPTSTTYFNCVHAMSDQMHTKGATLNNDKAISLAESNDEFKSKINGYTAKFVLVYNTWNLDNNNCNVSWNDVNVGYALSDKNGNYVKNVVVTLDPSLTKITKVSAHAEARYINSTYNNWSGYELGSTGNKVTESFATYTIPQIQQSLNSINKCVPTLGGSPPTVGCDLAVWNGLEDANGAGDGNLAQAGSDGNLTCNNSSCTSPTFSYYLFFQFFSAGTGPFTCHNALITHGDTVTSDVTFTGSVGTTGHYNVSVQDTTAGVGCSTTNFAYSGFANPTMSDYIDERASWTKGDDELAKFGSDTITGKMAVNGGALSLIASGNIKQTDSMENPVGSWTNANISESGITSGQFTQTWYKSNNT